MVSPSTPSNPFEELTPKTPEEALADQQTVAMRFKYGDERANHLGKVKTALAQYIITRTDTMDEGLDVLKDLVEALELAIKLTPKANDTQTN